MSYLIKEKGDGSASVLLTGSTSVCESKGAELWAGGDKGPLVVMCDRKGKVRVFAGDHADRIKGFEQSKAAQSKAQEVRNAEAVAYAADSAKRAAADDLARATEQFEAAAAAEERAASLVDLAAKAAEPKPATKKAAKKAVKTA